MAFFGGGVEKRIYLKITIRIEKFARGKFFFFARKIMRFSKCIMYFGYFYFSRKTVTNRDPATQVTGKRGGGGGSRKGKSYRTTMTMYRRSITVVAVV